MTENDSISSLVVLFTFSSPIKPQQTHRTIIFITSHLLHSALATGQATGSDIDRRRVCPQGAPSTIGGVHQSGDTRKQPNFFHKKELQRNFGKVCFDSEKNLFFHRADDSKWIR